MDDIREENIRRRKDKKLSKHFDILINGQTYKIVNFIIKESNSRFIKGKIIKLISKYRINLDEKDVRIEINHNGKSYNILADYICAHYCVGENIIEYLIKHKTNKMIDKNEVKKDLYKSKNMAGFSHYVSGNLYYKVELADGIYQFPIATVEEVEDTYTDGIVEETNTKLQLSEDLGVVTFNAEIKGSELSRWITKAIDKDEFIKVG